MHGRTARAYAGDAIAEKTVAQGRGHATPTATTSPHATPTVLTARVQADSQGPVG